MMCSKNHIAARIVAAVLIVVFADFLWIWHRLPKFNDTTAILFSEGGIDDPDRKTFVVTDPKEIHRIVSTIRLRHKEPCECSHNQEITFQKAAGSIKVSICGHCFSILGAKRNGWYPNVREYAMPAEFYEEFRALALARTNEQWHLVR